jgi:hypothetical protein
MTARVLIVDDVPANLKLLESRLSAEYFDTMTASMVGRLCRFASEPNATSFCST